MPKAVAQSCWTQGLLHSVEEQTWRVPLLVSWSAEESPDGRTAGFGVAEKAQAVFEEFQQRHHAAESWHVMAFYGLAGGYVAAHVVTPPLS